MGELKRRILTSAATGLAVHLLRYFAPIRNRIDSGIEFLLFFLPDSYRGLAGNLLLTGVVAATIFLLLRTRLGNGLSRVWGHVENGISALIRRLFGFKTHIYHREERNTVAFRRDISNSAKSSPFMFALLVSGYTICFEEEQFLRKELHKLPAVHLDSKDIRFLLLKPETPYWNRRAAELIEHRLAKGGVTFDHYRERCAQILPMLRQDLRAQVSFYENTSVWRLYIFSDHIYASRYSQANEPFGEGHAPVVAFDASHPVYEWLFLAFLRRCPAGWVPDVSKQLPGLWRYGDVV